MLISKFNRLIHNKMVWAAFAVLVSLSMVGFFAPSMGDGGNRERDDGRAGTLFGEPVTREDLTRSRLLIQLFRSETPQDEAQQRALNEQAWKRLAMERYAGRLGLSVSNEELRQAISGDPSFAVDGVFNRARYEQLIEGQMRVPVRVFEDYLRGEILMRKLQDLLSASLWIAPTELDQSVSRFTDRFALRVVRLTPDAQPPEVSDADVRAFYDRRPERFESPEQRRVVYVEWRAESLADSVRVSDVRIQDAYDRNLEQYQVTDTNTMTVSYTPLEEVEEGIRMDLAMRDAMSMAGEYAMQFLDAMEDVSGGMSTEQRMARVAALQETTVQTSVWFHASEPVSNVLAGATFNDAAFRLEAEGALSGPVIGDEAVYVLMLEALRPAMLQPYEAVEEQARLLAIEEAHDDAFSARVEEIRDSLRDALASAAAFEKAAGELGLTVETVDPFAVFDADPEDIPDFQDLAPAILGLAAGELTDPIQVSDDAVLLVYVAEREPGDRLEAEALKPDLARMLRAGRMRMHAATWSSYLLESARDGDAER